MKKIKQEEQGQLKQSIISNQSVGSYKQKGFDLLNVRPQKSVPGKKTLGTHNVNTL